MINQLISKNILERAATSIIGTGCILALHYFHCLLNPFVMISFIVGLYSELVYSLKKSKISKQEKLLIYIIACFYMIFGIFAINENANSAIYIIFYIFAIDSSAFFAGKFFKGKLLAPKISPNKTIAGFVFALITGSLGFFCLNELGNLNLTFSSNIIATIGLAIGAITQLGDLLISYAKRKVNIKNSSNILPGHGGLWDRFDSIFAGFIFLLLLTYNVAFAEFVQMFFTIIIFTIPFQIIYSYWFLNFCHSTSNLSNINKIIYFAKRDFLFLLPLLLMGYYIN